MPRLVTKFKYLKPGAGGRSVGGYARYIATREGAERIDDSYDELTRLMSRIESDKLWKGKEETTFMAYMGLMQQYHKSFSKANGDNPVQQAIDALKSHGDRVDDFYDEFQEYKDMEDM